MRNIVEVKMVPVDDQENRECVICLGRLEVPTTLKCCRHTFCFKCSEDWWKEMEEDTCCPVCRSAIQSVQMLLSDICVLLKEDEDHPLLYMAVREYEFRDVVSTMLAGSDSPGQAEAAAGEEEAVEEAPPPLIEEPPQPRHRQAHVPLDSCLDGDRAYYFSHFIYDSTGYSSVYSLLLSLERPVPLSVIILRSAEEILVTVL